MSWWSDLCECGHRRGNHAYDQQLGCQVKGCKFKCSLFRMPGKLPSKASPEEMAAYNEALKETNP